MKRLLRVEEVAEITGWKQSTVRAKILRREIPYVKLGKSVRISEAVLEALVNSNTIPAKPEGRR
ncbi:MAG TPA: helix-turn-helix domain-containing protein [Terriglobia bacterium]|nr:helix-turn-helix domain-containing protein [Terriglobia bacterium]